MAVTELIESTSFPVILSDATPTYVQEEDVSYDVFGLDSRSTTEVPEDTTYNLKPVDSRTTKIQSEYARYVITSISQASQQTIVNKAWDTVAGGWVHWQTETIDLGGAEYPGPGVFGIDTSDYRAETVSYTRS